MHVQLAPLGGVEHHLTVVAARIYAYVHGVPYPLHGQPPLLEPGAEG